MAGTMTGGKKAAAANIAKHGKDYYRKIGALGGKAGNTGGFHANPELAKIAGAKGGRMSHRGPSILRQQRVKEAKQMYEEGKTIQQIAAHFDVTITTAYNYVKGY